MKTIKALRFRNQRVHGFASWIRAAEHICDHLLTRPEARGWCVLVDWLEPIAGSRGAFEDARRMWSDNGDEEFQRYYDAYMVEISLALASGEGEGWHGEEPEEKGERAFGINGVLTIMMGKNVVTAYLPGFGDRESVGRINAKSLAAEEGRADDNAVIRRRRQNPLPREQGSGIPGSGKPGKAAGKREARRRERLTCFSEAENKWEIFKNSAKTVRKLDAVWKSQSVLHAKRLSSEEWEAIHAKYTSSNREANNER